MYYIIFTLLAKKNIIKKKLDFSKLLLYEGINPLKRNKFQQIALTGKDE